jgi:hypothetical protein
MLEATKEPVVNATMALAQGTTAATGADYGFMLIAGVVVFLM